MAFLHSSRFLRILLSLIVTVVALSASAQRTNGRDDQAARKHSDDVAAALNLVVKARNALRERRFERVREFGNQAVDDLLYLGGKEYATPAHEVLAEAAVTQGRWAEALREADACEPRLVAQRFAMTKALALIGAGRVQEARALALAEIGTPEKPGFFRQREHIDTFPMDRDSSLPALRATVYLIRSAWLYSVADHPEALDDIQAAVALTPRDATVHLRWDAPFNN